LELWAGHPQSCRAGEPVSLSRNGSEFTAASGQPFTLEAGERVTLIPGVYHAFWGDSEAGCIIGEVSTANDDASDNIFVDVRIGRFPSVEEDEPALVRLVGES
jgi:D-lyxose ketol-isomerase